MLTCASLPTANTTQQVAILEANPTCAQSFITLLEQTPTTYRDAFITLVRSPNVSDEIFSIVYDEVRFSRFRFDAATVDYLYANFPGAVAACTNNFRCGDWNTFILSAMYRGEMYRCPTLTGLSEPALLAIVPYGDYYCTESVASSLAPVSSASTITSLLTTLSTHARGWSRRNAIRIIGRFAERPSGDPARTLVLVTQVSTAAEARLSVDLEANVLHDCIWVLDSFFYPYLAMQPELEAIALGTAFDTTLRFRAAAALSRLINSKAGVLSAGDQAYLTSALSANDEWVRAQAAYTIEVMPAAKLTPSITSALTMTLQTAYAAELVLNPKVYMARALDRLNGTMLTGTLQTTYEQQHLGNRADAGTYTIRSGLDAGALPGFLSLMSDEATAFHDILGANFNAPVANDPNPGMTLMLFATRARYQEYMDAFVGYGSSAGGLYLEASGTLYTYERTPAESIYTVRELIQHEFGHYLQGRFVYPGLWSDPGYHTQPRGWADEGFAEVLGGLAFDGGTYAIRGRPQHVSAICAAQPFRQLNDLTTQRIGYDQAGVFDYSNGWALNYWLFTQERTKAQALFTSLRSLTYTQPTWASVAGFASMSAAQSSWHGVLSGWCTNGGPAGPGGVPASLRPIFAPNDSVCREVERATSIPNVLPPRGPLPQ